MLKKLICVFLAALLLTTCVLASDDGMTHRYATEYLSDDLFDPLPDYDETSVPTAGEPAGALEVKARSAILMDVYTGKILYENNSHETLPPASITKVMTLLLVMEAMESGKIGLDDMVQVSSHAASMGGSQIWLEPGEQMSVNDLLKAATVASANDAATALAEYVAGSEESFVGMMNARAAELGMNDTTFLNCTGLDAAGHLTSANDIAVMSRILIQHDLIREYSKIWMDTLRGGKTELVNTNKLVRFYKGTTGLKTGTTSGAGSCLSATAERDGVHLVAVVMGCETSDDRFNSARKLLDYGFANWSMYTPQVDPTQFPEVPVKKGTEKQVPLEMEQPSSILIAKGKEGEITQEITMEPEVQAPVARGDEVGRVTLSAGGEVLAEYKIVSAVDIPELTVWKALQYILWNFVKM